MQWSGDARRGGGWWCRFRCRGRCAGGRPCARPAVPARHVCVWGVPRAVALRARTDPRYCTRPDATTGADVHAAWKGFRDYWPSLFVGSPTVESALHTDWCDTGAWMGMFTAKSGGPSCRPPRRGAFDVRLTVVAGCAGEATGQCASRTSRRYEVRTTASLGRRSSRRTTRPSAATQRDVLRECAAQG